MQQAFWARDHFTGVGWRLRGVTVPGHHTTSRQARRASGKLSSKSRTPCFLKVSVPVRVLILGLPFHLLL